MSEDITDTVYFYYGLSNFYQNHRLYVKSRDDTQLGGKEGLDYGDLGACDPLISPVRCVSFNASDANDTETDVWLPCGLIAGSMFNDSFVLSKDGVPINWTNDGIAWPSDLEAKFINPETPQQGTWIPQVQPPNTQLQSFANTTGYQTPEFVVWMRTAGLPNFKKLNRIIHGGLRAGNYTVQILNSTRAC